MKRREFIAGFSVMATTRPRAQSGKVYRLAIFHSALPISALTSGGGLSFYRALFDEFRRLGYEEGRNLIVERYSGGGRFEAYSQIASHIVATHPDLIVTSGSIITRTFAAAAAGTVPIIATVNDPVATGLSTSLSKPSANVTGVVVESGLEIIGKRFDLLRELRPGISHVALVTPRFVWEEPRGTANAVRQVAQQQGLRLTGLCPASPVTEEAYRQAFSEIDRNKPDAIFVFEGPENFTFRTTIVELVNVTRIPAMYSFRDFTQAGGLIAYAFDFDLLYRHLAHQADTILRGRPVSEVPFYQSDRFFLIINLIAAKALDIRVPPSLLARADEVIE
jgi:putative ABC transport system substrate-binding protein